MYLNFIKLPTYIETYEQSTMTMKQPRSQDLLTLETRL